MILLDTHALVWMLAQPCRLSRGAVTVIRAACAADGLAIGAITLWELAVLFARGHLRAYGTVDASVRLVLDSSGVTVKPITPAIVALATEFPEDYPRDPADRLIGATARAEGARVGDAGQAHPGQPASEDDRASMPPPLATRKPCSARRSIATSRGRRPMCRRR